MASKNTVTMATQGSTQGMRRRTRGSDNRGASGEVEGSSRGPRAKKVILRTCLNSSNVPLETDIYRVKRQETNDLAKPGYCHLFG